MRSPEHFDESSSLVTSLNEPELYRDRLSNTIRSHLVFPYLVISSRLRDFTPEVHTDKSEKNRYYATIGAVQPEKVQTSTAQRGLVKKKSRRSL